MEIIIEGHKIDTKDIWDVQYSADAWEVKITVSITDKQPIVIGRRVPWEITRYGMQGILLPYEQLYKSIKEKWEADKNDIPTFKLK